MRKCDFWTCSYAEIFQLELHVALRIGLPLIPACSICSCRFVLQRRKNIVDQHVVTVILKNIVLGSFTSDASPFFQKLPNCDFIGVHLILQTQVVAMG